MINNQTSHLFRKREVKGVKESSKSILLIFVCLLLLSVLMSCQDNSNSEIINDKVHSINGEVLDIQPKTILSDTPFTFNTKEMRIYKFTYVLDGDKKVGWYRDTVFGDDWILDYQED
jgi:hypothetical protein